MSPALRNFLIIVLKNAINAIIVTVPPMVWDAGQFTIHNRAGIEHVLSLAISAVISREALVWGPVLLKWTTTNATPGGQG